MALTVSGALPVLRRMNAPVAFSPTGIWSKGVSLVSSRIPDNSFAVPVAGTSSLPPFDVTTRAPFRLPGLVGENLTLITSLPLGSTVAGLSWPERLSGYEIAEITRGAVPVFLTVNAFEAVSPTATSAKSKEPSILPIGAGAGCWGTGVSGFLASQEVESAKKATNNGRQAKWRIRFD